MVRRAWYRSRQPRARFIARWASRWCHRARAGERGAREHGAGERGASESGAGELGASERGGVGRDAWERQLGELQVAISVTTLPAAGQRSVERTARARSARCKTRKGPMRAGNPHLAVVVVRSAALPRVAEVVQLLRAQASTSQCGAVACETRDAALLLQCTVRRCGREALTM